LRTSRAAIVDPTDGLADLRAQRLPCRRVLDDPLRVLRGVRLEAAIGLRLTPAAARASRAAAPGLARVSAERVRDELLAMLALRCGATALRRALSLGVLPVVLPELRAMRGVTQPAPHRFDVLEHSLRAVAASDLLLDRLGALRPFGEELTAHMAEELGGGITRAVALKLAALLHDVAKPETRRVVAGRIRFFEHDTLGAGRARAIGERLRLPVRVTAVVERLCATTCARCTWRRRVR
jgi:putative nucleotidyltransferase with HDIG domain